jgi:DNA-binding transcriptional regulator YhcF (GntR family)
MLWKIDPSAPIPLQQQLVGCVRRAIAEGELGPGDRLPPAVELAEAVGVDRNTVLAAYRKLRDSRDLEFRRGRGVRVAPTADRRPPLGDAVTRIVELARNSGYSDDELIQMIRENR